MKTEKQIAQELHDDLVRDLVHERLHLDFARLTEPLKKQDEICANIQNFEDKIALLEKRYKL